MRTYRAHIIDDEQNARYIPHVTNVYLASEADELVAAQEAYIALLDHAFDKSGVILRSEREEIRVRIARAKGEKAK